MADQIDEFDFDQGARHVLELAMEEAMMLGHRRIGPGHLLLGLLDEGGVAAQVLRDLGVELAAVREAVVGTLMQEEHLHESAPPPVAPRGSQAVDVSFHVPPAAPPPALRQLVRVLPLAQTQVRDGVELTMLSLEVYTDGFLVLLRLVPAEVRTLLPESRSFPDLAVHVTDERGGRYDAWPVGGGGSPDQWRFNFSFVPPLDSAVRELRLEVPELRWRSFREDEPPEVQPGPWRFVVSLPGNGRGGP